MRSSPVVRLMKSGDITKEILYPPDADQYASCPFLSTLAVRWAECEMPVEGPVVAEAKDGGDSHSHGRHLYIRHPVLCRRV